MYFLLYIFFSLLYSTIFSKPGPFLTFLFLFRFNFVNCLGIICRFHILCLFPAIGQQVVLPFFFFRAIRLPALSTFYSALIFCMRKLRFLRLFTPTVSTVSSVSCHFFAVGLWDYGTFKVSKSQ